jgi:serine/threonine protein kinase
MFETTQHLFLLLEYSSGMDMYQWISMRADRSDPTSGEHYTQKTRYCVIKTVFDQVLEGVTQVHQHGIGHRDLKPENFLIEYADGQYTVKITDFGLATTDTESDEFECGSKPYMSFGEKICSVFFDACMSLLCAPVLTNISRRSLLH